MIKLYNKYNINFSLFRNLWKEKGQGITLIGCCLEFDKKSLFCFACLLGFVLFEIEIKEKVNNN